MITVSDPSAVEVQDSQTIGSSYLLLTVSRPKGFTYRAGQFATFLLSDGNGAFRRSYSIASDPHQKKYLQFCIQIEKDGRAAEIFKNLKKGDQVILSPAEGTFQIADAGRPIVLIAGGSGISPLKAFAHELLRSPQEKITLIYGCKSGDAVPYQEEVLHWASTFQDRFAGVVTVEMRADAPELAATSHLLPVRSGNVLSVLQEMMIKEDITAGSHFYLCGPPGMVQAVIEYLRQGGVTDEQIFFEKYS